MDIKRLMAEVNSPALHRTVLKGFKGPYSLGIGRDEASSEAVLLLMVPKEANQAFPGEVTVDGEPVAVVVRRDFQGPVPYASSKPEAFGA
jgi:hypothetical protein